MDRFRWRMTCRCPERRPERKNSRRKERPRRICPKKHCLKPGRRSCRQSSHPAPERCGTAGGIGAPNGLIGKVIQRTGHGVGFAGIRVYARGRFQQRFDAVVPVSVYTAVGCQRRFKNARKRRGTFVGYRRRKDVKNQALPCSKRVLTICCFCRMNSLRSLRRQDSPLMLITVQW